MDNNKQSNNQFELIHKVEEEFKDLEDLLIDDEPSADEVSEQVKQEEDYKQQQQAKKAFRKRVIRAAIVMFFVSLGLVLFGLSWQQDTSLMAIGDALWLAFALEFGVAWMMFIYNRNILSPLIHGVKTLALMFIGKRPKQDYYEYYKSIEEHPIPRFYYNVVFISAFCLLIPALIIMFILL